MVRLDTSDSNPINQKIIERMSQLFKDHEDKSVFSKKQRPLLMLFNRKQDIQGMFYHSWKYLSLIQDIFNIKHNSFQYKDEQGKIENLELDFADGADEILESNAFTGFHEAGPNVDKVFNRWTLEY